MTFVSGWARWVGGEGAVWVHDLIFQPSIGKLVATSIDPEASPIAWNRTQCRSSTNPMTASLVRLIYTFGVGTAADAPSRGIARVLSAWS
jgi:hypothetical protein